MIVVLYKIINNKIVFPALMTIISSQAVKLLIHFYRTKRIDINLLFTMSGMPSTYTALVASLVTSLAKYENNGVSSLSFGSSLVFAVLVMHDGFLIKKDTGPIVTNKVVETIRGPEGNRLLKNKLIEIWDHTPIEVIMGAIFGFLITYVIA